MNDKILHQRDALAAALRAIANSPHCQYGVLGSKQYDIGVVDGHRCAAQTARDALCAIEKEETMERIFEMTQADFEKWMTSTRSVPEMYLSGGIPIVPDATSRANAFWQGLGERMAFDWTTVAPCGKSQRHFSAVVVEATTPATGREEA